MESWVKDIVETYVKPREFQLGKFYLHPEDGIIHITSGEYYSEGRVSNFWSWTVVETGEKKHGYGGAWPQYDGKITVTYSIEGE